ncbi:MAG: fluoride efflux transporter CrcB [Sedimentisphaerales bacterium]|nr:fluoride efflux transporter CrcB [Sedimentisphaerales bacterium]
MVIRLLLIAAGGALGAVSRYGVTELVGKLFGSVLPWGTMAVNLVGSAAIGFLWAAFEREPIGVNLRMFVFVGILGGFTTFSSFTLETCGLLRTGHAKLALANIAVSNVVGIAAVFAGFAAFRYITK